MEIIARYGENAVEIETLRSQKARRSNRVNIYANDTKAGIISKLKESCALPEYLWESWDSLNDCLRDYDDNNEDCLEAVIECRGEGFSEEQRIFCACALSAMKDGQRIRIAVKASGKRDISDALRCVDEAAAEWD